MKSSERIFRSPGRMLAAYILSMMFSLVYGYSSLRSQRSARWLMPVLGRWRSNHKVDDSRHFFGVLWR